VTNGALGVLRGYLANAEQVRTGIEADASFRPSERFNVYGAAPPTPNTPNSPPLPARRNCQAGPR
jgi:iron complex outermembrane receptor protein